MTLIERLRCEAMEEHSSSCIAEAAVELEANAAEIGRLREELRAAQIAFKRIEQDYRTPAKMREIAGARAYNASELLGCLRCEASLSNTRKSDDGWRTMESGGEVREALAYAAVGLTGSKVVMEFDGRQQAEQMYEALKRLNG